MAATTGTLNNEEKIPEGMVLTRSAWYGDDESPFYDFTWNGKSPSKPFFDCDDTCPIFLYQSKPYLRGEGLNLQVVTHAVVATVLPDPTDVDLKMLTAPDYPIVEHFWSAHPSKIEVFDCDDKYRDHLYCESANSHCYSCDSVLGFDSHATHKCLHDKCTWPFPAEAVLAQKTSVQSVDVTSVKALRVHLDIAKHHLSQVNVLRHDQSTGWHYAEARREVEQLYEKRVAEIDKRAAASHQAYEQMKTFHLDKETLEAHIQTLTARISEIENGEAVARLRAEVDVLNARIAALLASNTTTIVV